MIRAAAALIPVLVLTACAANDKDFPSLERRPAERVSGEYQPAPAPPPPPPIDPATATRLDSLLARVREADARFRQLEPRARQTVGAAAGAAKGTERWSVAMIALAELDSARSQGMIALADIDALYTASRTAGEPAVEAKAAYDAATAIALDQDAIIDSLARRLAS